MIEGYETVPQWEERTGETYPDTAPVYLKVVKRTKNSLPIEWYWGLRYFSEVKEIENAIYVVASDKGKPKE